MPAPPGTLGASPLDGPPPNPAEATGQNPGVSLGAMAPQTADPMGAIPPEVLRGMLEACEGMIETYDSLAQLTPQWAADWNMAKNALLAAMAKVMAAGAPPTSPTATGSNFPGGGIDKGGMPAASGGM